MVIVKNVFMEKQSIFFVLVPVIFLSNAAGAFVFSALYHTTDMQDIFVIVDIFVMVA